MFGTTEAAVASFCCRLSPAAVDIAAVDATAPLESAAAAVVATKAAALAAPLLIVAAEAVAVATVVAPVAVVVEKCSTQSRRDEDQDACL